MTGIVICDDRRRILEATGHVLVTGGPGSGKTTIALRKAVERIEAGLEPGQKVLFISFSRATVARIVDSARRDLPRTLRRFLEIQTFHSFCWQLLQGHAYLLGSPRRLEIMLPHDERAHRSGAEEDDAAWHAEKERLFIEEGRIVFDLFAPKALSLLSRSTEIRRIIASRYPLVIVDEAQDTGDAQWACIGQLCDLVQLVCLADLEQQIYDFRPDVSGERVTEIMTDLQPVAVELGNQNNRSPGVEIVEFGNDILTGNPRGYRYEGIHHFQFQPQRQNRDKAIRQSVGMIYMLIRGRTGHSPKNIALLTNWGKGVAIIARALQGDGDDKYIRHRVVDIARHLILPAITLSLFYLALYTRLMRASVLEQHGADYVVTARAKGVSEGRIIYGHVLRNAVLPVVTMAGFQIGAMLGGSVVVEAVFGWPGLGQLAFQTLFARDYNLLLGIFFLSSVLVVLINLVVDLFYTFLDPRIELR